MIRSLLLTTLCIIPLVAAANTQVVAPNPQEMKVEMQTGQLKLQDLLDSSSDIAGSKLSKTVDKKLPGQIITMKGKKYELRYFSFEDTAGKLPLGITFAEYAKQKNILSLPSAAMSPLPGINFESFDFRRANLGDGVYFSMAVREMS